MSFSFMPNRIQRLAQHTKDLSYTDKNEEKIKREFRKAAVPLLTHPVMQRWRRSQNSWRFIYTNVCAEIPH